MEGFGIDTEEYRANGHAGALIIALRIRMDRNGLGVDPLQVVRNSLLGQAFGHPFEQAVAAVSSENDSLAPFGDLGSRSALKSEVTDDLPLAISRDHWDEFAALDLVPVATRREHVRVDVRVAINGEKAAGDGWRVSSLRHIDGVVAWVDCGGRWRFLGGKPLGRLDLLGQAAVDTHFPFINAMLPPGDPCLFPHVASEARRDVRKPGMAGQDDTAADVLSRTQHLNAGAFLA